MRPTLLMVALLLLAAPARADALPSCPLGQHLVLNPSPPGSMHHGGGHCEWGCAVTPGRAPLPSWALGAAALAALACRRQRPRAAGDVTRPRPA